MIVTKNKQTNKQTIKSKEHVHTICSIHKFEEKKEAEVEEARTTISTEYDEFIWFYYFHFS